MLGITQLWLISNISLIMLKELRVCMMHTYIHTTKEVHTSKKLTCTLDPKI